MAQKQVVKEKRLIIIGGSSGSLDALLVILPRLKKKISLPVLLIVHRGTSTDGGLTELFASRISLPVKEADEKEVLQPGWVYLAPPDYHTLLEEDGSVSLDVSEKVYYSRPSIDVSFRSAARAYKNGLVGILLSGANADGAAALNDIKAQNGITIVQDPAEALVPYMPEQAIELAPVDYILNAAVIADLLNTF